MKMMKKILVLFVMAMMLCACTGGKKNDPEPVQENKYDVAGKTYYDTVNNYGYDDHAKVWFGKDGSFILTDGFFNGAYEIDGTWTLSENVLTLNVEKTQVGQYSKIIFEVQDDDTIVLKTSLEGSKDGAVFSTTEVKGSDNTGHGQTANLDFNYGTYTDYYQVSNYKSKLELNADNTFKITDQNDFGIVEASGTFAIENGYMIVCKIVGENPFGSLNAIEFQIYDSKTLILTDDLGCSSSGDVFSMDGNIPEALQVPMGDNLGDRGSTWRYMTDTDVAEQYLPKVEFNTAGEFIFTENVYSGMAQIRGWYEKKSDGYTCHVDDKTQMQGYAGYDVDVIEFKLKDRYTLELKTDICMSRTGDEFELLP